MYFLSESCSYCLLEARRLTAGWLRTVWILSASALVAYCLCEDLCCTAGLLREGLYLLGVSWRPTGWVSMWVYCWLVEQEEVPSKSDLEGIQAASALIAYCWLVEQFDVPSEG